MGDEVIVTDKEYRIALANREKRRRFGKDIAGEKCYEIFKGRNVPCDGCVLAKAVKDKMFTREDWEYTGWLIGERCISDLVAAPVVKGGKHINWDIEIARDATIRKSVYQLTLDIQEKSAEEDIIGTSIGQIAERIRVAINSGPYPMSA